MFSKEEIALAKPTVEAIKKIGKGKWKWEPKVGELFFLDGRVYLIDSDHLHSIPDVSVPLLHWERIIKILRKNGYAINLTVGRVVNTIEVWKSIDIIWGQSYGGDPQPIVMQAVIELGEEDK